MGLPLGTVEMRHGAVRGRIGGKGLTRSRDWARRRLWLRTEPATASRADNNRRVVRPRSSATVKTEQTGQGRTPMRNFLAPQFTGRLLLRWPWSRSQCGSPLSVDGAAIFVDRVPVDGVIMACTL